MLFPASPTRHFPFKTGLGQTNPSYDSWLSTNVVTATKSHQRPHKAQQLRTQHPKAELPDSGTGEHAPNDTPKYSEAPQL